MASMTHAVFLSLAALQLLQGPGHRAAPLYFLAYTSRPKPSVKQRNASILAPWLLKIAAVNARNRHLALMWRVARHRHQVQLLVWSTCWRLCLTLPHPSMLA